MRRLALCGLYIGLCGVVSQAIGLSTTFVDVDIPWVPLGVSTTVTDHERAGITVTNTGKVPMDLTVVILIPTPDQLRGGAEPIPEIQWLDVKPESLVLAANTSVTLEAKLRIPPKKQFRNKYYQAMVWIRGTPPDGNGVTFSAGLMPRLRFRTQP